MTIVRPFDLAKVTFAYAWAAQLGRETSRRYALAMIEHLVHGVPEPAPIPLGRKIRTHLEQMKLSEPPPAPIGPVVNRLRLDALARLRSAADELAAIEAREPDTYRKMVATDRLGRLHQLIALVEDDGARDLKTDGGK
jgi:hypothetical protein